MPRVSRPRALLFAGIGAALSFLALAYYFVHSLSFEPTAGAVWQQWAEAPIGQAGGAGLVLSGGALVVWFLSRRRAPAVATWSPVAALVVVVVMVLVSGAASSGRHHPVVGERNIAASLRLPTAWGPSRYVVIPESPPDIDPGPPRVDRILSTTVPVESVCAQVLDAVGRWGATVSSHLAYGYTVAVGRPACSVLGDTPQGWSFDAEVVPNAGGEAAVTVEVAPPGV